MSFNLRLTSAAKYPAFIDSYREKKKGTGYFMAGIDKKMPKVVRGLAD